MSERDALDQLMNDASARWYASEEKERPTLRDRFAMAALTRLASQEHSGFTTDLCADLAYRFADAMLKAREVPDGRS